MIATFYHRVKCFERITVMVVELFIYSHRVQEGFIVFIYKDDGLLTSLLIDLLDDFFKTLC